jgi:hypothetical protein
MHHLDLGLFRYQIEYTRELLKNMQGNLIIDKIDQRLAKIPRFSGLKIFSHGIQSIARFTANEYRDLMKVMVFVIDNLYNNNIQNIEFFVENKELTILYKEWNEMYIMSRYDEFTESDLKKFKVRIFLIIFETFCKIIKVFKYLYNFLGIYNYMGTAIYKYISKSFCI